MKHDLQSVREIILENLQEFVYARRHEKEIIQAAIEKSQKPAPKKRVQSVKTAKRAARRAGK